MAEGGRAVEPFVDPEHVLELVPQPAAARRSPEQMKVVREQLPDPPRIAFDRRAVERGYAEAFERDPLRVEHPRHVVIGDDQQGCRIGERRVVGEHPRIDMTVRTDQRQRPHAGIQVASEIPDGRGWVEIAIGIEHDASGRRI